jgi:hypothetical protein
MLLERFGRELVALHEQDARNASYATMADALSKHGVGGDRARSP